MRKRGIEARIGLQVRPAYFSLPSAFWPSLDGARLLHERGEGIDSGWEEEARCAAAAGCAAAAAAAGDRHEEGSFFSSDRRGREGGREGVFVVWKQRGGGDGGDGGSHGVLLTNGKKKEKGYTMVSVCNSLANDATRHEGGFRQML